MKLYFHGFRSALALVLALTTLLPALSVNASRTMLPQEQVTSKQAPREGFDSFIIESVHGRSTCRSARADEVASTLPKHGHEGVPVEQLVPAATAPGGDNAENGLTINFTALPQLNSDPNRDTVIGAFQRAAAVWTARIKSPVTINIEIDYGFNALDDEPFEDNVLGSTSSATTLIDYPGVRTNLIAGASTSPGETALYNSLPGSLSVPVDAGNGAVVSVNRSVAFALGIPVAAPSNPLVAAMGFNKKFPFDFNPDNGITPGQTDFVAVAVHEIGHALGFTSGAGQGDGGFITLWDLFRFRPGMASGAFSTAQRVMTIGGQQVHFTGQQFIFDGSLTSELGLSTGGPDPQEGDGDERQSSHWRDDEFATGQVGIMDPTISAGVHETTTENDFMALEVIGWNLFETKAPPPAPPSPPVPANNNFASAQLITGCSGSVNGTTIGATREPSEPNHEPSGSLNFIGNRSVWYQWQAPNNGTVTITTAGSRFDTVLAVYTGSTLASLITVRKNDDVQLGVITSSRVEFPTNAGTIYRIAVDGFPNHTGGDFGPLTLNWTVTDCVTATPPQILLEESGPAATQAAAFDSILWLRDPFLVLNGANLINPVGDQNTRVVILVANISPSLPAVVTLTNPSNQSQNINGQDVDVRVVPNQDFRQVTFRLPTGLVAGTYSIKVTSNGQTSNTATIRIRI